MITNAKKTEAEKQLIKFKNQMHNLLIKYPEIRIAADMDGDVYAYIPAGELPVRGRGPSVYLPTSGKQEPIGELTANGVPVSL